MAETERKAAEDSAFGPHIGSRLVEVELSKNGDYLDLTFDDGGTVRVLLFQGGTQT